MDTRSLLMNLSRISGVSGRENDVFSFISGELLKTGMSAECIGNISGNLVAEPVRRTEGNPHVLIDAHADEIGFITAYIDDEGFIVPSNIGGMDFRIFPAQKLTVHGKKDIPGVVCTVPPHLSGGGNVTDAGQIRIDTGYSAQELRKLVSPGDFISFRVQPFDLQGNYITGKSLDNRAGAAVLILLADMLKDERSLGCSYSLLFSSSEEIGQRGAKTACFEIDPDIAVAVDVSFAYSSAEKRQDCGIISEGPMIGISPSLSREISDLLADCAESAGIKCQPEVMSGLTGTNADQFAVCRKGVKTGTCSVPIRYMHTPAEVADIRDIENTAALLAEFIRRVGQNA